MQNQKYGIVQVQDNLDPGLSILFLLNGTWILNPGLTNLKTHLFLSPPSPPSHSSPDPEELLEEEDVEDFLAGDFSDSSLGFLATFLTNERRVLLVLTNERRVLLVLTNERPGVAGLHGAHQPLHPAGQAPRPLTLSLPCLPEHLLSRLLNNINQSEASNKVT